MNKCPCCDKELKSFRDFPKIYVADFKRVPLTEDINFPSDFCFFAGPDAKGSSNPKVPREVTDLFKKLGGEQVGFDGWIWTPGMGFVPPKQSFIQRLRGKENTSSYNTCFYNRAPIGRHEVVGGFLEPYLKKLESLVGKEISRREISPPEDLRERYEFDFVDAGQEGAGKRDLILQLAYRSGGSMSFTNPLATIGKLAYEGRLNKHT